MLVLTRKTNQSIMIGDDVEVTVLAVSRDKIRLGISAPKEVPVFRKEVWLSMKDGTVEPAEGEADDGESKDEIEGAIIDGAAAKVEEALGRAE
ncbi:MAG TPA: carbon storage regulator CsrA [Solirubrobacterales bacterium]|nr:carbon storage regulator CsrA [Solirubrobacterales bacterium]